MFSLTELGQMNGSVVGGGGAAAGGGAGGGGDGGSGGVSGGGNSGSDKEMPAMHEVGEELIWTGRCPPDLTVTPVSFTLVSFLPTLYEPPPPLPAAPTLLHGGLAPGVWPLHSFLPHALQAPAASRKKKKKKKYFCRREEEGSSAGVEEPRVFSRHPLLLLVVS